MDSLKRWIITLGGVGHLPASGTFASLLTCLILWPILWAAPSAMDQNLIAGIGIIVFSALSVVLGPWATARYGKDPGEFVLDEAAGICLTILFLPPAVTVWAIGVKLLSAFVVFRIFDITKPPPARQLEHLPQGWGILLDDLAAAVYANLVCQVVLRWIVT